MAGIRKDSDPDMKPQDDKSMRALLIAFLGAASIAASIIVVAYATGGGHAPDGTETGAVTDSHPEQKIEQVADEPLDTEKAPGKPVYNFAGYIDKLLANADNDQNRSEQASDEPASEPAEEPASEPAEEPASEPAEEPASEPAEEPASEPAEEPASEPAEEPASEPAEEPASEPAEEPASEPAEEPASEPAEEPAGEKNIVQDVLEKLGI